MSFQEEDGWDGEGEEKKSKATAAGTTCNMAPAGVPGQGIVHDLYVLV